MVVTKFKMHFMHPFSFRKVKKVPHIAHMQTEELVKIQ